MTLLVSVADARGAGQTAAEFRGLLADVSPVEARLDAMVHDGMVVREGDDYRLGTKGQTWVAMNAMASLGFAFGYFNFVNLAIVSLQLRMLKEIANAGGPMPRQALLDRYGTAHVTDLRLERLVQGGHLVERNGRLYTGRLQFLAVARIFDIVRRVIFGPAPEVRPRQTPRPLNSSNRIVP